MLLQLKSPLTVGKGIREDYFVQLVENAERTGVIPAPNSFAYPSRARITIPELLSCSHISPDRGWKQMEANRFTHYVIAARL